MDGVNIAHKGVRENFNIRNVERRLERGNGKPEYGNILGRTHTALNSLAKQELVLRERRQIESKK